MTTLRETWLRQTGVYSRIEGEFVDKALTKLEHFPHSLNLGAEHSATFMNWVQEAPSEAAVKGGMGGMNRYSTLRGT